MYKTDNSGRLITDNNINNIRLDNMYINEHLDNLSCRK
jgi:hypothetical protein